ncbi:type VI secretion system secreted protein VgrG [Desulfonatronum zhilinae]|nr:type VI secretion system secreted protein VgrG [Desulfonatronum zhilinae]
MPTLKENAFTFVSQALPEDTFTVVRFSGEEGLSTLYSFDILLVSEREDVDLTAVLQNPATLTIKGSLTGAGDLPYHGILSSFEQMHQAGEYVFYRAELRPRLWWLTLTHHNQIFLNKKLNEFLPEVLEDGGLSHGLDFEFQLQEKETPREYVCQYGESHFAFVSRWMEWDGIYYWFEQGEQGEKLIASDTLIAHAPLPSHETMTYAPPSGLDASEADHVIKRFTLKQNPLPRNVLLKDYNYMKPTLDLEGKALVQDKGRGEIYLYGEHFQDKSEGDHLAKVRAEEFLCREKVFRGLSSIPALRPGYTFQLQRHYREEFNQGYLTTHVRHEGSQERYLLSGLGLTDLDAKDDLFYRNTFQCIPASTQYRPARVTPKPQIAGTLSARIDAAGSGQYAELDKYGRYKVILPFDLSGRSGGKASAFLRMMQPYAGEGMGFHAPLHKGTEVLLSFIDADPDRPVISGAVPNPETPSPVRDENQTQVRLVSGSGNVLHMEDEKGKERILMHSPTAGSFIRVGFKNDPGDDHEKNKLDDVEDPQGDCMHDNTHGIKIKSEKTLTFESGDSCTIVHGDEYIRVDGEERYIIDGATTEFVGGAETTMVAGNSFDGKLLLAEEVFIGDKVELSLAEAFALEAGLKAEVGLGVKLTFHEMEEEFIPKKDQLEGVKEHLQGEVNKLIADHNKLVGSMASMSASSEHLSAQVSRLTMATQDLNGQVRRIAAEEDQVLATRTAMIGEALSSILDETETAGAMMQITGDKTQLLGIEEKI